jgi:hypothetical protein
MIGVARRQTQKIQTARTKSVPAPIGGVNARDAIANMPATDAISCDNFFCQPSYLQVRNGEEVWASGLPAAVETVMPFTGTGTNQVFAVSGGNIYNVTAQGAVGAALVTGLGTSRLQHAMFNTPAGSFLLWADGSDTPQVYNGTSWANSTVSGSGLSPQTLISVTVAQQRCWYIQSASFNVWYSAAAAFQGVLTVLPLGQYFKLGGYLMAMADWTIDNIAGMNDYTAFISSEGEVAVYQGYDPTQIGTFSLVGVFKIGRPIGRRCIVKFGSDVLCITADGLTPLSRALLSDRTMPDSEITYKIRNAINADIQSYAGNFGWQVIEHPIGQKLIVNVPEVTNSVMHQWVMNTVTKAFSRFRNWNANCWAVQQDSLYYGGYQNVYLADTGANDAGLPITVDCKPAFSYFDEPGVPKLFQMARPIFQTSSPLNPVVTLNVDFNDVQNPSPPLVEGSGSPWNTSPWNTSPWSSLTPSITDKNWQGVQGEGYAASGRISMQTMNIYAQWDSTDYLFSEGRPI